MSRLGNLHAKTALPSELAVAAGMSDVFDIPFAELLDPDATREELLPFLAASRSVDLWFSDWSIARRRKMVKDAPYLASIIGTRDAAAAFLAFVDATIVHKVSYPAARPLGLLSLGIDPFNQPTFTARFLVKTELKAHPAAFCLGRSALGRSAVMGVDAKPLDRAMTALTKSKAPETAYSVSFAHRVVISLDDGIDLDAGIHLGAFRDRTRL